MKPPFFFFLILLLMRFAAKSQQPVFVSYPSEKYPPVAESVSCLYSNGSDFIWIASGNGLLRFDGLQFLAASPESGKQPAALTMDSSGTLWVASENKLWFFDKKKNQLSPFSTDTFSHAVNAMLAENGQLWMATAGGGIIIKSNNDFITINTASGLNDDYVYCLEKDHHGNIWAGTDQGIAILSSGYPFTMLKKISVKEGLPDAMVRRLKKADNKTMYIGMQRSGVAYVNESMKIYHATPAWSYGEVNDLITEGENVWVASQTGGLVWMSGSLTKTVSFTRTETQNFSNVSAAIKTFDGFIWFASEGRLYKTAGMRWAWLNSLNGKSLRNVHAVFADSRNNLWFTPDSGLTVISENHQTLHYTLPQTTPKTDITCFYEDDCGHVWIGTVGSGLFRFNRRSGQILKAAFSQNESEFQNILSISGKGNTVWVATFGGVFKTSKNNCADETPLLTIEPVKKDQRIGNFYVYHVFVDSKGKTWFATDGDGLACYDGGQVVYFDVTPFSSENVVYSITEDMDGNLWLSIHHGGLLRFDGKQFRQFTMKDGLKSNAVQSVFHDGNNGLVLTYENGLDFFDTKTGFVYSPGKEFGFEKLNPDLNAVTIDTAGNIWIGTSQGLIKLSAAYSLKNIRPASVLCHAALPGASRFVVNGESLKHNENLISLLFCGFWNAAPEQLVYRYKLSNNDAWITAGDRQIVLSGLPPGGYEVIFQASHHPSFLFPAQATFQFEIRKPFWKQVWFMALLAIGIAALILMFIRLRENQHRKLQLLEKEKTIYRYETLKAQVNPHFLFNSLNTLISVIETEPREEASLFAQQLSDFFRSSVSLREKDSISLREETTLAETYAQILIKRFGNRVEIRLDIRPEDFEKKILPMSLQMLIENALKHNAATENQPLKIEIRTEGGYIFISNNIQPKKNPEVSTQAGLQNIINRYRHYGREDVEIQNDGKVFTVKLPLLNSLK